MHVPCTCYEVLRRMDSKYVKVHLLTFNPPPPPPSHQHHMNQAGFQATRTGAVFSFIPQYKMGNVIPADMCVL